MMSSQGAINDNESALEKDLLLTRAWRSARIRAPSWPGDRGQVLDLVEESPHSAERGAG